MGKLWTLLAVDRARLGSRRDPSGVKRPTHDFLGLLLQLELDQFEEEFVHFFEDVLLVLFKENVVFLKITGHVIQEPQKAAQGFAVHRDNVNVPQVLEILQTTIQHQRPHEKVQILGQRLLDPERVDQVLRVVDGNLEFLQVFRDAARAREVHSNVADDHSFELRQAHLQSELLLHFRAEQVFEVVDVELQAR